MSATYHVNAKTKQSSIVVFATDAADALRRAREMAGTRLPVTITDGDGVSYSLVEFEALASGYTAVERGEPTGPQAPPSP